MTELSPDENSIIEKHPLTGSVNRLRDTLREAEKAAVESRLISYDGAVGDDLYQFYQNALSKLLLALMDEKIAFNLPSRITDGNVDSDLADLYKHLRKGKGNFMYDHYRLLVRLVIQRPLDDEIQNVKTWNVDIWKAVFNLIDAVSRMTLSASVPPSFDGTPVPSTSLSSQRGPEQTRELVEAKIFKEIQDCIHRDVGGFFAKYFEGRDWSGRADAICRRALAGSWAEFPDPPTQNEVQSWWFRFQDEFLSDARSAYFSTRSKSDLVGSDADRQLDLLLKARGVVTPGGKHDWKDIRMVVELKESKDLIGKKKGTPLQMGRYVRDVFIAQPTRRFVHAFAVCGPKAEAWVFDRSGAYSSGVFNIYENPGLFFRMIAGYAMMTDDELGLDTFMARSGGGGPDTLAVERVEGGETTVRLDPDPLSIQHAIVCRGTTCFLATADDGARGVAKFSWVSDKRAPEEDLLNKARERGVRGVAEVIGHRRITDIAELRGGLTFGRRHHFPRTAPSRAASSFSLPQPCDPGRATQSSKRSRSGSQSFRRDQGDELAFSVQSMHRPSLYESRVDEPYDNRILRCLVISPVGRPIYRYESPLELLKALRDAIKAHRSLYLDGNILHRDISENNIIIIADPAMADGNTGMLIDLDLAKEVGSGRGGARHQTGTREFMAIEVLLNVDHTYRHDLESFFYVLIWQCAHRGWGKSKLDRRPKDSMLKEWYTGTFKKIANTKRGNMQAGGFEYLLQEFPPDFECVKPLCKTVRRILFPYGEEGLIVGTPQDPKKLYDPIIKAYDEAITLN
ncbi:hypothetical protein ACJ72_04029 [Emergomyces africanus]|uniref:non-specific serine/threonine protein kinase n=1 Tax=Emergomyces africanus TaxID=1955775 RepID=A0A1B7NXY4_9EURO|nr:hypothetical protein ACJ72_04029 [Emergomyces africanus]